MPDISERVVHTHVYDARAMYEVHMTANKQSENVMSSITILWYDKLLKRH